MNFGREGGTSMTEGRCLGVQTRSLERPQEAGQAATATVPPPAEGKTKQHETMEASYR